MATPTDPLFAQQWHFPLIGNIQKIWDEFNGTGVSVVVYDDGVQANHADLAANYDATQHFSFGGTTYVPTPIATTDAHGTACAGIIAAVDNNGRGGTGVAHGATITGVDYLNTLQYFYDWNLQQTSATYDAVMRWAANFDIMSNSWGTTPSYAYELNLHTPGGGSATDAAHFAWLSANGRGGLGTIIVKAAGNETMNANGDGSNVSRHTITVAATEQTGFAADYSNFGSSILLTAPAAAVTTDLMGTGGYNTTGTVDGDSLTQTDYTSTFGGTSAATPVVAGVVALMLDANSNLGWRDVQGILAMSAGHTGSAVNAAAPSATEVGFWKEMGGTQWNGGGMMYHLSYGFGMVDAFAAVRMAEVWSRLYGAARTSATEQHLTVGMPQASVAIADNDGNLSTPEATINFVVSQNIEIDSVQVTLDITHSYGSDLTAYLRSPTGQLIALFAEEGSSASLDFGLKWTFAAEAFRGMSSQGTWSIIIHDDYSGDTGTVFDASLDFYGSANSVNDVYHFTDDFKMLRDLDADRRVIDDTNGGTDWLNFAAMTGNLNITMAAGGAVKVNGVTLATLGAGTVDFERLQAGDGNDVINGNDLNNVIYGQRGNDTLNSGIGNDVLYGGVGNDSLLGGSGNDILRSDAGNDVINGGSGNDQLTGGAGNDRLDGSTGLDSFVFARNFGRDTIVGWVDNQDTLQLDDAIWGGGRTVAQILSTYGTVTGGSVVLTFSAAMTITLQGITSLSSLSDDITII